MNKKLALIFLQVMFCLGVAYAQVPSPGAEQSKPIALMNGTAHLGNGKVIENAVITFRQGKIETVADARTVRMNLEEYEQIDAQGKHIYPGLILPVTNLGLVEVEAVRSTRDFDEVGMFNPNVRSVIAYNTESELVPTLRFNGILMAQIAPKGGLISGTSSVVQLDAWNWEDAAVKFDGGLHMNWPSRFYRTGWWTGNPEMKANKNYANHVEMIEKLLADAKAYSKLNNPEETNLKLQAMKGLFDGSLKLYLHVDKSREIMAAVKRLKAQGVKNIVLVGAEEALMVKEFIKENNLPVLLANVHRLPEREDSDIDMPYKLPSLLHKEGIKVGLTYEGAMSSRNLPFFAGTTAAYGMDKEEALQLVTQNTADILGVGDKAGTLESGKDANIVVSTGDLLDMRGNNVEQAFIQGRKLNMEGRQQRLYKKYKKKYQAEEPVQ